MDKSYKLKFENWMAAGELNQQLLIFCVAKFDARISRLTYDARKYKNAPDYFGIEGREKEIEQLTEYRSPFLSVLCKNFHMSIGQIKDEVAATLADPKRSKNIPTHKEVDVVRELILSGQFSIITHG